MNFVSEKELQAQGNSQEKEEEIDRRPLYNRLKEVRDKKQLEIDEERKLKNQFRGIDDGEADFLRQVDKVKEEVELKRRQEEIELLKEAKETPQIFDATEPSPSLMKPTKGERTKAVNKQASLISAGVRKRTHKSEGDGYEDSKGSASPEHPLKKSTFGIIGVLPGLVNYEDSSSDNDDSENSGSSDIEAELPSVIQATRLKQENGHGNHNRNGD